MPSTRWPTFLIVLATVILGETPLSAELMNRGELHSDAYLEWSSFVVTAEGRGTTGPVTISGKQAGLPTGLVSLTVQAFGRKYRLDKEHLAKLKWVQFNGMQVFYAPSMKVGERKLYIRLSCSFISDFLERRLITISERGEITIEDQPPPWKSRKNGDAAQQGIAPDDRSPSAPARR